jgi:hypothetical protein
MHFSRHTVSIVIMLTVIEMQPIIIATQQKIGLDHCIIIIISASKTMKGEEKKRNQQQRLSHI